MSRPKTDDVSVICSLPRPIFVADHAPSICLCTNLAICNLALLSKASLSIWISIVKQRYLSSFSAIFTTLAAAYHAENTLTLSFWNWHDLGFLTNPSKNPSNPWFFLHLDNILSSFSPSELSCKHTLATVIFKHLPWHNGFRTELLCCKPKFLIHSSFESIKDNCCKHLQAKGGCIFFCSSTWYFFRILYFAKPPHV